MAFSSWGESIVPKLLSQVARDGKIILELFSY